MERTHNIEKGLTFWLTGLSGSGKTTIATNLQKALLNKGFRSVVLDGDKVRKTINKDLNYTDGHREENNRRVAEISKIINDNGIIVISSLISPSEYIRQFAKKIIGSKNFILIYIDTPQKICEERDEKLLYQKAKAGGLKNFTGISSTFEIPGNPDFIIDGKRSIIENIEYLLLNLKL